MKPFQNEPLTDFSNEAQAKKMRSALARVRKELGQTYPLIIHGQAVRAAETFTSVNPANVQQTIGVFQEADEAQTEQAITAALEAFQTWKQVSPKERASYLFKIAAIFRKQKFELAAWLVYEVGKNWVEADAELAEAIDFLEYYGREMIRLASPPKLVAIPAEKNELRYLPLGVGAIITPWNFPLAILAGMTLSAVVCGNTAVLKPSEFSPAIAFQFMKIAEEAGIPKGVIQLLTGRGATVGRILVRHPKIRFISFTGSKKVGLEINEAAAKTVPGQKWIKRVIAEMGGKDAIIVDSEADLEKAAAGVIKSAFGFNGQKCSACSRAIIDQNIYDPFVEKLLQQTKSLKQGNPEDPKTAVGPLVSQPAIDKAKTYIEIGKKEGKLLLGGTLKTEKGYFVEPTIFGDVSPRARLAQEEIFAPVLALIKARNFDHALEIANDTEYGLTGAFYTKNPQKMKQGREVFHVGNLYANRGCTGAFVGAHPFGGFNMSGTDSKAGGPDYLLLFLQAQSFSQHLTE